MKDKQLKQDVAILKDMACIAIARQYSRMAKSLMEVRKHCKERDFIVYLEDVVSLTDKALKRFEK